MALNGTDAQARRAEPLSAEDYIDNFADLHPPLTRHEALVESDRCYFCYDAPCITACPTAIDIPLFIREIMADNRSGAGRTIFEQNIMGGMCARVCPTETLCEEACVRQVAEGKPVKIGLLQRHATDLWMEQGEHPFTRAPATGKRVAIVGAGPAGLSCAHRLAMLGHDVEMFDAREKPGGLNEYGIAAYKTVDDFAQREVDFILSIGGITIHTGKAIGRDLSLEDLRANYDAVFLGLGLAGVNALEEAGGSDDAVAWIADLRQTKALENIKIGRRVIVIGGGMTAVDAAVQAKALGAEEVTIAYRGPQERMKASGFEQQLAQTKGVSLRFNLQPRRMVMEGDTVAGMEFERVAPSGGVPNANAGTVVLDGDQVFKAIGQSFVADPLSGLSEMPALEGGRIRVDEERRTSLKDVWAGGDCVAGGQDLTVSAVEDGKQAAISIDRALTDG